MTLWLVRAGRQGEREDTALEHDIACVGWDDVPDLSPHSSREAIESLLRKANPPASEGRVKNHARQLFAFAHRMKVGDLSSFTWRALAFGEKRGWGDKKTDALKSLIRELTVVDIRPRGVLDRYAEIVALSGDNDAWIAATTAAADATLLTTDKDFDHLHPKHIRRAWIDPDA